MQPKRKDHSAPQSPAAKKRTNRDPDYTIISSDQEGALPTPDNSRQEITTDLPRPPRARRPGQLPESSDEDAPPLPDPPRPRPRKAPVTDQDEEAEDAPLIPNTEKSSASKKRGKAAAKTHTDDLMGKVEKEHGTRLQGIRWITYAGWLVLNSLAEFEECIMLRLQTQRATYNARAKTAREENRGKELDLEIELTIKERWKMLPPEERVLEVKSLLLDKEQEVLRMKNNLAATEAQQVENDRLLEAEKGNTAKCLHELQTIELQVLREKRFGLNNKN